MGVDDERRARRRQRRSHRRWVWLCPFCEVAFDSEADAYTHRYEHQDKAPCVYVVLDECF
jgi:nitric oxide synthase oxygenase domain/subunit